MDRIIELLRGLKSDLGALRGDVKQLSDKVEYLSGVNGTDEMHVKDDKIITKSVQDTEVLNSEFNADDSVSISASGQILHGEELVELEGVVENISDMNNVQEEQAPLKPSVPRKQSIIEKFFVWLAEDWPMKVGGFFVVAAIGWFVTYAAAIGWLSPIARVILGYLFAVSCIAFGSMRAGKEQLQGNLFLIIGIAAVLIATLAGIHFEIIVEVVALAVMLVAVALVSLISLKQENEKLTIAMIFFGGIIPMFFFSGIDKSMLFVYLFVLTLGTLWIVLMTGWKSLTTLMLAVVGFYSVVYILNDDGSVESVINILLSFIFAGVFYVANIFTIIRAKKPSSYDILSALTIGSLILVWILSFASKEYEVMLLLVAVLFFALASYIIFLRTDEKAPSVVYGGVTATLFTVAITLLFEGSVRSTVYLVEAASIVVIALYFIRDSITQGLRSSLVTIYIVPVFISLYAVIEILNYLAYPSNHNMITYIPELFTVLTVALTAFFIAIFIFKLVDVTKKENMTFFRIFAYIGGFFSLLFVWFITHMFIGDYDIATFISLVLYTVVGGVFYMKGVYDGYKPYMIIGGILFAIVVGRVLVVEFWEMKIVIRMITSFVLGALLISTAFIKKSKK